MKRILSVIVCLLMLFTDFMGLSISPVAFAETISEYQTITVAGFNQDLIADGEGIPSASTTSCFDDTIGEGNQNVFYSKSYKNAGSAALSYGLPDDRVINSANLTGAVYQLASYTGNNALLLVDNNETGTLTFDTSGAYEKLAILAASAHGLTNFTATVNFSDGTSTDYSFSVPDWNNGDNYAIQGVGRVGRDGEATNEDDTNPRLYDNLITLNGIDQKKLVTSITFKKTQDAGRTGIFAVCGVKVSGAPETATAIAATSATGNSFAANWNTVTGAGNYRLDVATDSNFINMIPGYNNLDVQNVTNYSVTGLAANTTYYYRVRAENENGQGFSSSTVTVTTLSEASSDPINASLITVKNYVSGLVDKIIVTGLQTGDIVNVYDAADAGNLIATATEAGSGSVTITTSQLLDFGGSIYLTRTSTEKVESSRVQKNYNGQPIPWSIYDHTGNWGEQAYPNGDENPLGNTYNKHIIIKSGGSRITFYGYGAPAYNDFLYLPSSDNGEKTFTFNMDVSTLNFHSMQGAGVIFNTQITNGKISGYALLYTEDSKFTLYELNNVDVETLYNGNRNIASVPGVTQNATKFNPNASNPHSLIIKTTPETLNVWDNGAQIATNFELTNVYGNGLGLFAAYKSHGCPILSYFTITDVTLVGVTYSWPILDLTSKRGNTGEVNLTFSAPSGADSILLQQSTDGVNFTPATTKEPITEASTTATVTGLDDTKRYFFRLLVGGGTSEGVSNIGSVSSPIIDLAATGGDSIANLTFTAPEGARNVVVQKSTDGINFTNATTSSTITQGSTSAVVTGLTNGQQYSFRLVVTGGSYEGTSNTATATPNKYITDLTATGGDTVADLTFTAPAGAAEVVVEKSTDGITFTTATTTAPLSNNSTSATVTGLTNGQQYSFRLVITGGTYAGSNIATATPMVPPAAPAASNVRVTGTEVVGGTLTGEYSYFDRNGDLESGSIFKWYRSDNAQGLNKSTIDGATGRTYTLVGADAGKFISFEVAPKTTVAPTTGAPVESGVKGPVRYPYVPAPTPTPTQINGDVVDSKTGDKVKGVPAEVTTEANGTKTVAVKSEEAISFKQPSGTGSTLIDVKKLGFSAPETTGTPNGSSTAAVTLKSDGTIQVNNLINGSETKFDLTFDLGNGQKIVIGTMDVKVSQSGEVSLTSTLIDPYGIITDTVTGEIVSGANLTLYYANTGRNKLNGKTPDTMVELPILDDFKPNNNKNPQISDAAGAYGWMVYPETDYYIVASKDGNDKYISPTISVEQEIVKWDFSMSKTKPVITLKGNSNITVAFKGSYIDPGARALDYKNNDLSGSITVISNVNTSKAGDYEVIYNVKDSRGVAADSVKRIVHVAAPIVKAIVVAGTTDSLSGSVLASAIGGIIVDPKDYRLIKSYNSVSTVYILGGNKVVSNAVEKEIKSYGIKKVVRLGGVNAYQTSQLIAKYLKAAKGTPIILMSDRAPLGLNKTAAANNTLNYPIIYTTAGKLDNYSKQSLLSIKPPKVYVVGDIKVISDSQLKEISKLINIRNIQFIRINTIADISKIK